MGNFELALLLGIIEGLTEFLPISSTAHLRIAQALFGLDLADHFWKVFAIVIQMGAILSVILYFWKRLLEFFRTFLISTQKQNHPLVLILITFFVTAIPAFLLSKIIEDNLESLAVIGGSLLVGGVAMWIVDIKFKNPHTHSVEKISKAQAVWIGLVQILSAVFPGVSRSMSTLAAGQIAGLTRAVALEFSFFVSIPIMMAATGYELLKSVLKASPENVIVWDLEKWKVLGLGFTVSFVVAYIVNAWFLNWVKKHGFSAFAIYRMALGIFVLLKMI